MIPGSFTELQCRQHIFDVQQDLWIWPHSYPASSLEQEKEQKLSHIFLTITFFLIWFHLSCLMVGM